MNKSSLKSSTRPVEPVAPPNQQPAEVAAINIMVASEKGGVWKSFTAGQITALIKELRGQVQVFEIDDQEMLLELFPHDAVKVKLSDSENDRRMALGDVKTLEPALSAMTDPSAPSVVLDLGAERDLRLARAFNLVGMESATAVADRENFVLVPMFRQSDSVLAGSRTIRRFQIALPSAKIIVCICGDRNEQLSMVAQAAWDKHIEPAIEKFGTIELSQLEDDVMNDLSRLQLNLIALTTKTPAELAKLLDVSEIVARAFRSRVLYHVGKLREQLEQVGLFRQSAE